MAALHEELRAILAPCDKPLVIDTSKKPFVILMVGVNGVGKTTTIGKLAKRYQSEGHSVMLAAGDTFRAAAVEPIGSSTVSSLHVAPSSSLVETVRFTRVTPLPGTFMYP